MNFTAYPELETKVKSAMKPHFQHILKKDVTLDAEPYATIPAGTPLFGEEQGHFIVFQFGEYKRQIPKTHF